MPSGATNPQGAVFSPNGAYLATADNGSMSVTIFNVAGGVLSGGTSYNLPGTSSYPLALAFSPDGSYLATANISYDITLFQMTGGVLSGGVSTTMPTGASIGTSLAFSPDGQSIAVGASNSTPGVVTMFALTAGALDAGTTYTLPAGSQYPYSVAFSSNGLYLATANGNAGSTNVDCVTVFQVSSGVLSGAVSYSLPTGTYGAFSAAFSPDDLYLAVLGPSKNVTMFSVGAGGVLSGATTYALPSGAATGFSVAFSPNGAYLATADNGPITGANTVTLFNVNGGVLSNSALYTLSSSLPYSVRFSPDSLYLATADSGSNDVTIFSLQGECPSGNSGCAALISNSVIARLLA